MSDDERRHALEMRPVYAGALAGVVAAGIVGYDGTIAPFFWGWLIGTAVGVIVSVWGERRDRDR